MLWKVALCQMDVALGDPEENRRRAAHWLEQATGQGAQVAVLPELWTTAYALDRIDTLADRDGEPTLGWLESTAQRLGLSLVAGSIADHRGSRTYNTAYIISNQGERLARYDKVHLFRLMAEEKFLAPGDRPGFFRLDGVPCGVEICYDLRFPEISRTLALAGAKVIFIPAEWPEPRLHHWRSLLIARAIENQAFVIAVNRVGRKDPAQADTDVFFGHSLAVSPWGEVLAEAGEKEELKLVELDLAEVDRVRQQIPVFSDRAPQAYRAPGAPPLGE